MPDCRPFAPWCFPDAPPERPRLPEPSPPPWVNPDPSKPLPDFYRPIFTPMTKRAPSEEAMRAAFVCAGLSLIGAVLPIVQCAEEICEDPD